MYLTKSPPTYAPILLLFSDMAAEALAALAAECGASGFITKHDDLVEKVAEYLLHRPSMRAPSRDETKSDRLTALVIRGMR